MKVWIGGNSHTATLRWGCQDPRPHDHDIKMVPFGTGLWEINDFSKVHNGRVVMTEPLYAENLLRWTGRDHIDPAALWGICMGTHNGRIYRRHFWQIAEPSTVLEGPKRPISEGVLSAIIEEDQKNVKLFISRLKANSIQCFVISCPPPRLDHEGLRNGIRKQVVAYIDQRAREQFVKWLEAEGIAFIAPPPEVYIDEFYLDPKYNAPDLPSGPDPHHGNGVYGRLMMERVLDFLDGLAVAPH